jgi:hypothetical protein
MQPTLQPIFHLGIPFLAKLAQLREEMTAGSPIAD